MNFSGVIFKRNKFLIVSLILFNLFLVSITIFQYQFSKKNALENSINQAESKILSLEQYLKSTFGQVSQLLLFSENQLLQNTISERGPDKINQILYDVAKSFTLIDELAFLTLDDQLFSSTLNDHNPVSPYRNSSEFNIFSLIKKSSEALFVSRPYLNFKGQQTIAIGRKISGSDQKNSGFLFAFVPLSEVTSFFGNLNVSKNDYINIWGSDKFLLMNYPQPKDQINVSFSQKLNRLLSEGEMLGHYLDISPIYLNERLFIFKFVNDLNLYVEIVIDLEEIYKKPKKDLLYYSVAVTVFILFSLLLLLKHLYDQEKFEEQRLIALQASKMSSLGEVSANIAHEINNPLSVLVVHLKKILEMSENVNVDLSKLTYHTRYSYDTTQRIVKIISGLKKYSRLEKTTDPFDEKSIKSMIDIAVDLTRDKLTKFSIDMTCIIDENIFINCHETQIIQVFVNLINNSIDAITEANLNQKWIKITFEQVNNITRIRFYDSGLGIGPELSKKILLPFYTTKSSGKGTGLGLSISVSIMNDHGGKLWIDSDEMNTCFVLDFPIKVK